jgi:hypothetical protein
VIVTAPLPRPRSGITRPSPKKTRSLDERPKGMNPAWGDAQIVLDFYQTCLRLLVWLLAAFACLGILASVMLLCLECLPSSRSAIPEEA